MSLAATVATGNSFIGYDCITAKRVLYFDLELKDRVFWACIDQMFCENDPAELNNLIRPNNLSSLDIYDAADQKFIVDTIALTQPDLIIWDVLSRMHCRNENDNSSMKQSSKKYDPLATQRLI